MAEYESALRLDPAFTAARARIGVAYVLALNWNWATPELPPETLLARAVAASDQALREDSLSSDAWMARGAVQPYRSPHFEGAREAFRRAVTLDPDNADAHTQYATVLRRLGDFAAGEAELRRSLELDPRLAQSIADFGFIAFQRRRYGEAVRWYASAGTLEPTGWNNRLFLSRAPSAVRDSPGPLRAARETVPPPP